jgi:predicted flap endonuclease-1-like 5' DNA nuclease
MVQTALDDGRRRLQQLSIERDAAFAAEVAAKETVTDLQQATQRNSHDVDRLRQQREEVLTELKVTQSDREQLTRELKHREQKIATLQATCDKLTTQKSDREALAERLSNQAERLRKISLEHELTAASLGQAEQTIDDLRQQLDSREQTIDDLQRERDKVDGGLAGQSAQESTGTTRIDPRLGSIYIHEPAIKDDLKQISGVVESLEKKLNDFGVYTYEQIMDWDDSAIEAFSDLLAFKDRISREDWVAQARRLHSQAHGRAA